MKHPLLEGVRHQTVVWGDILPSLAAPYLSDATLGSNVGVRLYDVSRRRHDQMKKKKKKVYNVEDKKTCDSLLEGTFAVEYAREKNHLASICWLCQMRDI